MNTWTPNNILLGSDDFHYNKMNNFPSPFDGSTGELRCLVEREMIKLSAAIRAKPKWFEKMKKYKILKKWRSEAKLQSGMTDDQINYVFEELVRYRRLRSVVGDSGSWTGSDGKGDGSDGGDEDDVSQVAMEVSGIDGVWQADGLIGEELLAKFLKELEVLENVPEEEKDWHPGTNNVLDLIHPSLFCRVLKTDAEEKVDDDKPRKKRRLVAVDNGNDGHDQHHYQWLPAEFQVDAKGNTRIESYINNLHPGKFGGTMYKSIAEIFSQLLPMFERVLGDLLAPLPHRVPVNLRRLRDEEDGTKNFSAGLDDEDDTFEDEHQEAIDDWRENRTCPQPKVPSYSEGKKGVKIPEQKIFDLRGKKLQVIVKVAEIILTPENPVYKGGSWHVEGTNDFNEKYPGKYGEHKEKKRAVKHGEKNHGENIVSSAICYLHSDNITESKLSFRESVEEPDYEQNDNTGLEAIYGLKNDGPLNEFLGSVVTKGGRCIAFPNIFQHKVEPFELVDRSRSGCRKILVFFLVDPGHGGDHDKQQKTRIISTKDIWPQQAAWWREEIILATRNILPTVLVDIILEYFLGDNRSGDHYDGHERGCVMTLEEAKTHRLKLMDERKFITDKTTEEVFERPFSLCEH